jgi:hypothetical protein
MTDELHALVVTEQRGLAASATLSGIVFGAMAFFALRMFPHAGYVLMVATCAFVTSCLVKRHGLGKLLDQRNQIARVDRVDTLGRPALRVHFLGGGGVTLPTWNHDRERVFALLERRELPPARLL